MLFYIVGGYEGFNQFLDLELNENLLNKNGKEGTLGKLRLLLEGNLIGLVDEFERRRKGVIYGYQINHNLFVDYPKITFMI